VIAICCKIAVHGSNKVAGQIWSYLYAMKASGVKHPMGAIMTYNRLSVISLDDLSASKEHKVKVEKTRDVLASDSGNCDHSSPQRDGRMH
jgi:hypothetical protein